ncbi:hypothetical protein ACB092_01G230800 [Castanea dentata]
MSANEGGGHEGELHGGCWMPTPPGPMSCLSWNYHELGNPQTVDELVTLVGKKDPKVVFLMETKSYSEVIERVHRKIQFAHKFVIPRPNQGGGLALRWKEEIQMDVQTSSDNHIDTVVDLGMDDAWRITVEEKQGWLDRPEHQMQGFRDALDFCGLRDIGYNGFPFTWCNHRCVATMDWLLKFPTTRVHHLEAFHSDHRPLLLASDSESRRFYRKGCPFRLEAMWLKDKSCETVIKTSWETPLGSSPVANLSKKIDICKINLHKWNRNTFGHVQANLEKKLNDLHRAEEMGLYSTNPDCIG